ncbi:TlpA disulfide reductase family protein [Kordia sp.]|uniref:TlpA family protein disulfide reductase n=1 Tax=Kordia sp. TaxID=1965332 RepID=UPI0025C13654|nr:TlpA disulfide reductase family protein [Kordia sp.]MCH2193887.1 TlpA family protein disulfide reductase [Kordia sp.]
MNNLLLLVAAFAIFSCKNEPEVPKDYVTLSGKIENQNSDSLVVRNRTYSKTIKVNKDGTFKDTLKVENGMYNIFDGSESTNLYLENDFDLKLTLDTKMFDETIKYSGKGAIHSNFLAEDALLQEKLLDMDMLSNLDTGGLEKEIENISKKLKDFYNSKKDVDSTIIAAKLKDVDPMLNMYKQYAGQAITLKTKFSKGTPSPAFDYENHAGGKTSLADLKGKYVYIDMWATWCGPCKAEIPSLKKIETSYHDKNIAFVSISVDENKDAWQKMVTDKSLGGIQLHYGGDETFMKEYMITGIPRFILLDPDGNVVSADAPRPSNPKLVELFNELNI